MSFTKTFTLAAIGAGLLTAAWSQNAHADITSDKLQAAKDYGFTHIEKIEYDRNGRIEIDGWGEDGWYLEVEFDGDNVVEESRERKNREPWGLTFEQVDQVLTHATEQGLRSIKEVDVDRNGRIEVEGRNENDRKHEVKLQLADLN